MDTQLVTRLLPSLSLVFTFFLFLGRGKGREATPQFLPISDWSGLSPSWSVLICPHLLCPPLCRSVLLATLILYLF